MPDPNWTAVGARRDASDQTAAHADDALGEVYAAHQWPDENRGDPDEGRPWSREKWQETGNGYY